jgi:hypothetical protein
LELCDHFPDRLNVVLNAGRLSPDNLLGFCAIRLGYDIDDNLGLVAPFVLPALSKMDAEHVAYVALRKAR